MPLVSCDGAMSEREERVHVQRKGDYPESRMDTNTLFVGLLVLIVNPIIPIGQRIRAAKHRWPK